MPDLAECLQKNLAKIRWQITEAAKRSGRQVQEVRLVAITKSVSQEVTRALVTAGCRELGESRPQLLWEKAEALADLPIQWHLVGHLQRNKIRRTLPLVEMIHSLDSLRLAQALEEEAAAFGRRLPVLFEVNISHEEAKTGLQPNDVEPLLEKLAQYQHLEVRGLMGMASWEGGLDIARKEFAVLRALRDRLQSSWGKSVNLTELSMGMSMDFEVAIEEGSTLVRVGSALFEGIDS